MKRIIELVVDLQNKIYNTINIDNLNIIVLK